MTSWNEALRDGALAGSVGSVVSALYLARAGHRRRQDPAAPLNAVSHWFFGDAALRENGPSVRHTRARRRKSLEDERDGRPTDARRPGEADKPQ